MEPCPLRAVIALWMLYCVLIVSSPFIGGFMILAPDNRYSRGPLYPLALLPLIVISNSKSYTLLLSTNTLFGQYSSDWTAILSALILAAIPVIVFYSLFQKQILKGIAEGAVKG